MITFLRRIRKSWIESGNARKYILYALGEIALLVIGILIALKIHNWNEERKNQALEQVLLQEINEEFKYNLSEFENNLHQYDIVRIQLQKIIHSFPIDPKVINVDTFAETLELIHFQGDYDMSVTAISKLKSTSSLDIISNQELRSLLIEWEVLASDYQITETQAVKFHQEKFAPLMYEKLSRPYASGLKDPRVDLQFLGSLEFEGLIKFKFRRVENLFRSVRMEPNIVTVMKRIIELSQNE